MTMALITHRKILELPCPHVPTFHRSAVKGLNLDRVPSLAAAVHLDLWKEMHQ